MAKATKDRIELSQLLRYVSEELQAADTDARASGRAVMQFAECKLEIAVAAEREGKGGLKIWVLELGGGAKKTEAHTVTITMKALDPKAGIGKPGSGKVVVAAVPTTDAGGDRPFKRQTTPARRRQ